jgi:hypothetical protein
VGQVKPADWAKQVSSVQGEMISTESRNPVEQAPVVESVQEDSSTQVAKISTASWNPAEPLQSAESTQGDSSAQVAMIWAETRTST